MAEQSPRRFAPAPDQADRDRIWSALDCNLLVEAAAGTGKTTCMVGRMVALLSSGVCSDIGRMAAVTFTRKAAAELQSRFQVKLEAAAREAQGEARERLSAALGRAEQCFVGTVHAFCARLLRERPVEAGLALDFEEMEPEEDMQLRQEAWAEYGAGLHVRDPDRILEALDRLGLELADLEQSFSIFASYPDVEEWPASGAGEAVFEAIGRMRGKVERYIAEVERIVPSFPETGEDDLMIKYKQIRRLAPHFDLGNPRELMELLELWRGEARITQYRWSDTGVLTKQNAKDERARWNAFREEVVVPLQTLWFERRYGTILAAMKEAQKTYDRLRASRGLLNYQDLLMRAAALLRDRPHIRRYFQERYTHLLVDEFHDTDPVQAEVMLLLTSDDPSERDWRACRPRPGSLFVVGDPKQSIYRFRRADIVTYNEVKRIIAAHGEVVRLFANFRSSAPIIEWVNRVFGPKPEENDGPDGPLLAFAGSDSETSPAYVAMQAGRAELREGPLMGLHRLDLPPGLNQPEAIAWEADFIARAIRRAIDGKEGLGPGDFLIVTYNTHHLGAYGQALQAYGIPHQVTGGGALGEVEELMLFYRCLRAAAYPDNPVTLVAALRSPLFGVSDAALYAFKTAGGRFDFRSGVPDALSDPRGEPIREAFARLRSYAAWLDSLPPLSAFSRILSDLGLLVRASLKPGGDLEAGSLLKAIEILRGRGQGIWSVADRIEQIGALARAEERCDRVSVRPDRGTAVRVMNLHQVKGLEAPVVFLACPYGERRDAPKIHVDRSGGKVAGYLFLEKQGSDRGSRPIALAPGWEERSLRETAFARAERLRLRYVAATRAGAGLIVTKSTGSKEGNNPWKYFLPYLPDSAVLADPGKQPPPARPMAAIPVDAPAAAANAIAERLARAARPTYGAEGAKAFALRTAGSAPRTLETSPSAETGDAPSADPLSLDADHRLAWGSVMHRLLEAAMQRPGADLRGLAEALLREHGLDGALAETARRIAEAVIASGPWIEARQSRRRFTEAPFWLLLGPGDGVDPPTVVRGAIDLAYETDRGWVLVDYKTDSLKRSGLRQLAEKYAPQLRLYAKAWERCTGEKVARMELWSLYAGKAIAIPPE